MHSNRVDITFGEDALGNRKQVRADLGFQRGLVVERDLSHRASGAADAADLLTDTTDVITDEACLLVVLCEVAGGGPGRGDQAGNDA